ncbi:MAG TPA: zinc-binding dehydrogenase [Acidimicrobiaceae bacterium]|nr:zinc-binding dehydrogenase [Acidimicrobiaceae bacterium]
MPAGRGVTIRAAVSHGVGVPPSIEDLQLNAPNPNEVRVEITACAVCHSDLSYLDGTWATDFPLVLGHEATGYVVELGESGNEYGGNGSDLAVGDPVVITLIRSCGICRACRRGHDVACTGEISLNRRSPLADTAGNRIIQGLNVGAFAEQVVVHRSQVVKLPDDVDPVAASLLGCGVLTGYGAVANTAQVAAGDAVVVVGCGGVGSGALQAARIAGADPILAVDPIPEKRVAALGFGATHVVDPARDDIATVITRATGGYLADHLLVTTGAPAALDGAIDLLAPMGNLVIVGMAGDDVKIEVAPSWLAAANKSILGSKMGTTRVAEDIPSLIDHHRAGRLDLQGMVSSVHSLDNIAEAFDEVWRGEVLRTVVLPNEAEETFQGSKTISKKAASTC